MFTSRQLAALLRVKARVGCLDPRCRVEHMQQPPGSYWSHLASAAAPRDRHSFCVTASCA